MTLRSWWNVIATYATGYGLQKNHPTTIDPPRPHPPIKTTLSSPCKKTYYYIYIVYSYMYSIYEYVLWTLTSRRGVGSRGVDRCGMIQKGDLTQYLFWLYIPQR